MQNLSLEIQTSMEEQKLKLNSMEKNNDQLALKLEDSNAFLTSTRNTLDSKITELTFQVNGFSDENEYLKSESVDLKLKLREAIQSQSSEVAFHLIC